MKNLLLLMKLRWKLLAQNKRLLVLSILGPILITLALSLVFRDVGQLQGVPVAVVDLDQSDLSRAVMAALEETPALDIVTRDSDQAQALLESSDLEAIFTLEPGFGQSVEEGKAKEVVGLRYIDKNYVAAALGDIVAREVMPYVARYKAANRASSLVGQTYEGQVIEEVKVLQDSGRFALHREESLRTAKGATRDQGLSRSLLGIRLSLGFTLSVTAFVMLYGAVSMIQARQNGTYDRMKVVGLPVFTGWWTTQWLFASALLVMQAGLFTLFTPVFTLTMDVALHLITFGAVLAGVSVLLGMGLNNTLVCQSVLAPGVFFMGLIGGTYWSLEVIPPSLAWVAKLSPFSWAMEGLLASGLFNEGNGFGLVVLVGMGLVLYMIGRRLEVYRSRA